MSFNLREIVVRCCTVGQGPASRRTGKKFLTQLSDGLLSTLSTMTGSTVTDMNSHSIPVFIAKVWILVQRMFRDNRKHVFNKNTAKIQAQKTLSIRYQASDETHLYAVLATNLLSSYSRA